MRKCYAPLSHRAMSIILCTIAFMVSSSLNAAEYISEEEKARLHHQIGIEADRKVWFSIAVIDEASDGAIGIGEVVFEPTQLRNNRCIARSHNVEAADKIENTELLSWKLSKSYFAPHYFWFNECDIATSENSVRLDSLISSQQLEVIFNNKLDIYILAKSFLTKSKFETSVDAILWITDISHELIDRFQVVYDVQIMSTECDGVAASIVLENGRFSLHHAYEVVCHK